VDNFPFFFWNPSLIDLLSEARLSNKVPVQYLIGLDRIG
jgi:hypothetical protein